MPVLRKLPTQRPRPILPAVEAEAAELRPRPEIEQVAGANPTGTAVAVGGCVLTMLSVSGELPAEMAHYAAIGFGLSVAVTLLWDLQRGLANVIRADVMALISFYFLTFFEFLFPQTAFNNLVTREGAATGITAALLGGIGLLVGRHLWRPARRPLRALLTTQVPPGVLVLVFWACFILGYLHMFVAVNFDITEMVKDFMEVRFSQPWSRGRLGDWKALLVELGLFIQLLPPLAGIMLARRGRYPFYYLVPVLAGLLFTLFYGFTSGTRNVLASYLVTLLIGYAFAVDPSRRKEIISMAVACATTLLVATPMMLAFRTVGFRYWIIGDVPVSVLEAQDDHHVFVDYNLWAICQLAEVFPDRIPYLGFEIPYQALIRPIPRAIWPGKPEGLSYSIEDAMGMEGLTISATFVGEAWMSGGYIVVFVIGAAFGLIFAWWNYLASTSNSELGILIYASGFFCAVISMRSLFAFSTSVLPTVAAIGLTWLLVRKLIALERRLASALLAKKTQRALQYRPQRKGQGR